MSLSHLSPAHLRKASKLIKKKEGFLAKVRKIEFELDAFAAFGTQPEETAKVSKAPQKKRRKMSAATKAKMAAAQKARWAKVKTKKTQPAKPIS